MNEIPVGVIERIRNECIATDSEPTPQIITKYLRESGVLLTQSALLVALNQVAAQLSGLGPLEDLLRIPRLTDIVVNGPKDVWIITDNKFERAFVEFEDEQSVRLFAVRLASTANRRLDEASPFVDARLPSGIRLHAILPPLASSGTSISLRLPAKKSLSLNEFIKYESISVAGAKLLEYVVDAQLSFLICGGTGSGKTTVLSALLSMVDAAKRIVVIEDSSELQPSHPHVVTLQAKLANVEGVGAITMRTLIRQALRMRPDRIVVGEVRGEEIVDLLVALNTGHEGGCGTIHANSALTVPARIESLGLMAGLPSSAIHAQIASGLDVVLELHYRNGHRIIDSIYVVERNQHRQAECHLAAKLHPDFVAGEYFHKLRDLLASRLGHDFDEVAAA